MKPFVPTAAVVLMVAAGQSNVQFTVAGAIGGPEAVAASRNPLVRQFTVGGGASAVPLDQGRGTWAAAAPETTGAFSAVGYFFARRLNAELGVPVGVIHAGIGGSVVEAWTSAEALATVYLNGVMVGESADIHPRNKVPAGERLAGNTVIVTSPAVREPMAVRYAWADTPACNLANDAGLLASPFRTDDFPAVTASRKY